jgi:hypothetical protein
LKRPQPCINQIKYLHSQQPFYCSSWVKVKILRYEPATSQVNVEMKTAGRLQGTTWWLDASAVGR